MAHIREEIEEVEADPEDVEEWVDVIILALNGAMRMGHSPEKVIETYHRKMEKNRRRQWPDWRTHDSEQPIKHI